VENYTHWFVIDRNGIITFVLKPTFSTPTAYQDDVDAVLRELEKAK
jgi:peroxiredoxin